MPAGATQVSQNLWSSHGFSYNAEHIFFHLPAGNAAYEIWVSQSAPGARYGIAWWAEAAPAPQPRKVGDKVWRDLNSNGLQDAGEAGVHDVTVQLYTSSGMLVDSTTTDYEGNYSFEVAPGSYYVRFTPPYAMGFTGRDKYADDTLDSDADASGQTAVFTVGLSDDWSIDAGLASLPYGSIGNHVWNDTNGNGIQDVGETGVPGVEVTLYTSGDEFVTTATTDSNGFYAFTSIAPGSYYLTFQAPINYGFSLRAYPNNPW